MENINFEMILLGLGALFFLMILVKWHLEPANGFDLKSILTKDGEFSLSKVGQFVALMVSTWTVIYTTRHGQLTDFVFNGYMLSWAGANLASKIIDLKNKLPE